VAAMVFLGQAATIKASFVAALLALVQLYHQWFLEYILEHLRWEHKGLKLGIH